MLLKEILKKKSLGRTLTNLALEKKGLRLSGKILDLGGRDLYWEDGQPRGTSAFRFMRFEPGKTKFLRLDIDSSTKPEYHINFEKDRLPFDDNSVDNILVFNLFEHIYNHRFLAQEIYRVLQRGGRVVGSVPFLLKIHPDPNDFFRYSKTALKNIFKDTGFSKVEVEFIGNGPFCAEYSQIEFILPRIIRPFCVSLVVLLDKMLLKLKPKFKQRYALAYLFVLEK